MDTSLGLLETGLRKRNEVGPLHPDFGKFNGDGLPQDGQYQNEGEMMAEIDRLRSEVESYIIMGEVAEAENNNLHNML